MITAIGNPVYDYIKTQKIETEGRVLSGCSTNAALALSRLGEKTRLIGAIGDDFKDDFVGQLDQLDIESVIVDSKESGGFSLIYYDNFGNRTLDLLGRASDIGHIDPKLYKDSKAVLIGPILGEVSFDEIKTIRKNFDGYFFCDPQGLLRNADEDKRIYHEKVDGIEDVLGQFTVVKPNELEGKVLTGIDCRVDPYKAAGMIKSWGPEIVIVTLAELGSVIFDGHKFIEIPPYQINLLDSTGAGDTYMAGFTFEYLRTGDLRQAGCFASCVSSIMIEQVGPDFVMTEAEVRRRQKTLLEKTDFTVALSR
ncbi:MAG: ribokinase [candidate division Zixibacteria bacterium HGW-Zixibacteria-1]|nr:MAG: ribokinase [candidate division Zixibacteria bacterium HGW-Zixibacteria-1]